MIEGALQGLASGGDEIVAIVLAGGGEKLPAEGLDMIGSVDVHSGADPRRVLDGVLSEVEVDRVVDLSDEPVLDYRKRHALASVALAHGVSYEGADFSFRPPPRPRVVTKPSLAIIGTGKRTGKTAIAGFAARTLASSGRRPLVVAMGRGGPGEPEVLHGDDVELTPESLLELADQGKHAASDYVEDALLGRVTTIGCRRCGGGLAGGVDISNVGRGIELANDLDGDVVVLEGSGSAIPPAHADATILVLPANIPEEHLVGYMGPYRLLLADLALVTISENPFASPSLVSTVSSLIRDAYRRDSQEEIEVVRTVFRPHPTHPVAGSGVYVATTAPEGAAESIRGHLEGEHDCRVLAMTHALSDRKRLKEELDSMQGDAEVMLCEIKAAGVDVVTRWAIDRGMKVVYMDNVPVGIDGDDPGRAVIAAAELAEKRFSG